MKTLVAALVCSVLVNLVFLKECLHPVRTVQCVAHLVDRNNTKIDIETECQI